MNRTDKYKGKKEMMVSARAPPSGTPSSAAPGAATHNNSY